MRTSPRECLTEAEIEAYVLARMPQEALNFVEEHLLVCGSCIEKVEAEEGFVQDFRTAAELFEKRRSSQENE